MVSWLRTKMLDMIFYVMYARLFLEAHESMILSCSAEIYEFDTSQTSAIVSQGISWFVLIIVLTMPTLAVVLFYLNRREYDPDKKTMFMEFFEGLKNTSWARFYTAALLIRRILFV